MEGSIYLKSIPLVFDDHGSKLLKALYEQQQKSQLCDVSLVVENVSFPAHKALLAAHSDYFYALFDQGKQSDDAGSKACNVTTIHLSSITTNTFIPILHFLYTSRLHVFCENIRDVMRTARKLQISTIVKACERLLTENVVLPSVHEVRNKQSSDTIVAQDHSTQSVLYVDLRSEDDDDYHVVSSVTSHPKTQDTTGVGQVTTTPQSNFAIDQAPGPKSRGRTQKKKGFPKKIQLSPTATNPVLTSEQTSTVQNISTVSPASIFGRVGGSQSNRRNTSSPMFPSITSSENVGKASASSSSLTIDPLPFENNLESLNSIFGNDSALIIDSLQSESSLTNPSSLDKVIVSSASSSRTTDSLQLQSVFSMSPKLLAPKANVSVADWSRFRDTMTTITDHLPTSTGHSNIIATPSQVLKSPGATTPSVYTCKECFKYFTSLSDAFRHFYTEHQHTNSSFNKSTENSSLNVAKSHTCPHCGRIFNNKNNLKRHILIKHTSDKRFKCSLCGRRYAIRQSLQYHIRSVHGREPEDVKMPSSDEVVTSPLRSSYQFDEFTPIADATNAANTNYSFTLAPTSNNTSISDISYSSVTSNGAIFTSAASYLTSAPLQTNILDQDDDGMKDIADSSDNNNLPTIQRIESIRPASGKPISDRNNEDKATLNKRDKPGDSADSKSVKAEPRPTSSTNTAGKTDSAFPGGAGSSGAMLTVAPNNSANNMAMYRPGPSGDDGATVTISGGTPFVLSGASTLQALLPAFSVDYSKTTNEAQPNVQSRVTPRLHRCDHCARIFSTIHAYTRHRRACNKHECPICHRGFSQMGNMRRHIKIFHSDQKPYECKVCNKAYGIQQSFRYHMRDKHGITVLPKPASASKTALSKATGR